MLLATFSAASPSLSRIHIVHPSSASARAIASPIPAAPPVTAAMRPLRLSSMMPRCSRIVPHYRGLASGLRDDVLQYVALVGFFHRENGYGADYANHEHVSANEPRPVAPRRQKRRCDDRRETAREYTGKLIH